MKNYGKITAALVVGWFAIVVTASALGVLTNGSGRIGLAVAIAALTPVIVFGTWFAASSGFQRFALSLDPRILTAAQSWRVLGFVFIVLEAKNVLPAIFALPAGYGDMAIGATAAFAALNLAKPGHRRAFIAWQVLGIADLIVAITLGPTAPLFSPNGASMAIMTVLPLSLIPAFLVPLFAIFHFICIRQARTWKAPLEHDRPAANALQAPAL